MAVTGSKFRELIDELHTSVAAFAKVLGVNNKTISSYIAGMTQPNDKVIGRVYSCYPDLNKQWFETGKGSIWVGGKDVSKIRIVPASTGVRKIVCSAIPPTERPVVDVKDVSLSNGDVMCPYYDVDFACGFPLFENDQTEFPERFIVSPVNRKGVTVWCNATGRSMEPTIMSGDAVALERIEERTQIIYGEIYAIVTNSYRTIKRICQGRDKNAWVLISDNQDKRVYADQEIDVSDVIQVYRVTGSMHRF